MIVTEQPIADWVRLIRTEFDEMPGLVLTSSQIQRMWGIESNVCRAAMDRLVAAGVVMRRADSSYAAR